MLHRVELFFSGQYTTVIGQGASVFWHVKLCPPRRRDSFLQRCPLGKCDPLKNGRHGENASQIATKTSALKSTLKAESYFYLHSDA